MFKNESAEAWMALSRFLIESAGVAGEILSVSLRYSRKDGHTIAVYLNSTCGMTVLSEEEDGWYECVPPCMVDRVTFYVEPPRDIHPE